MDTSEDKGGWISFSDQMPTPAYDRANPGPTHGYILVTNNISARNRWGKMSHVWLVSMVHTHDKAYEFGGMTVAYAGEITAFTEHGGMPLRGLTHWRPAIVEEWAESPYRGEDMIGDDTPLTELELEWERG